jgi:uncharacterized protein (DUF433 family)
MNEIAMRGEEDARLNLPRPGSSSGPALLTHDAHLFQRRRGPGDAPVACVASQNQVEWTREMSEMADRERKLVTEIVGGEPYEYYPLGEYIVAAPGVYGGQPTFKYRRIGVQNVIELLSGGWTVEQVSEAYNLPVAAIQEALALALQALHREAA